MKKDMSLNMKNSLLCILGLALTLMFFSCENFLEGLEIKNQIDAAVNLANAPAYQILLDGSKGKFSPVKGSYPLKVTQGMNIAFESDSDYEFIEWEVFDASTDLALEENKYIEIGDPKSSETTIKLIAAPENGISLGVRSILKERPTIISYTPLTSGVFKDSSIQVLFDCDMDPLSIYYTQNEIAALGSGITKLPAGGLAGIVEGEKVYYGYKKDGETYFKNILITDKKTGANINKYFEKPIFENPSTLIITANKGGSSLELPAYTQVLVSIDKDMYCTYQEKPVKMAVSKKWLYQVSNSGDNKPLVLSDSEPISITLKNNTTNTTVKTAALANFSINQTTGTEISKLVGYFVNDNFNKASITFKLKVLESGFGSGPKDSFTIYYRKAYDANYKPTEADFTSQTVSYDNVTSDEAFFNGTVVLNDWKSMDEGVYEMYLAFGDKSNNTLYYPSNTGSNTTKYYFAKDKTTPTIDNLKISSNCSNNYTLTWDCPIDIKTSSISIKKTGGTATTQNTSRGTYSLSSIEKNIGYEIKLSLTDYLDHTKTVTVPKFLTEFELGGTLNMGEAGVFFEGDTIGEYGLSVKKYYSDNSSVDLTSNYKIPSKDDYTTNPSVTISDTCTEGSITKSISKTYSNYYTVKADALTPSPVKITYSGAVPNGIYYKFGDYPQTLSNISKYTSGTVYNGWYLGKDGYFYEYTTEEGFKSNYYYANKNTKVGTGGTNKRYFKVEPVVWRRLTTNYEGTGRSLLQAEKILTAIKFLEKLPSNGTRTVDGNDKVYVTNYKYSSLRAYFNNLYFKDTSNNQCSTNDWRNNGFLKKAFTPTAQENIATTTVDNSAKSTMLFNYPKSYNNGVNVNATCGSTNDKIFALSWWESTNPAYGFKQNRDADDARVRWTSDYALAKGAYKNNATEQSGGFYWTRSPHPTEGWTVRDVDWDGYDNDDRDLRNISKNEAGAVPALTINNSYLPN